MTFEDKIEKLEDISNKLSNDVSLQEGLKLFEEGANISKDCLKELSEAKGKITKIKKDVETYFEESFN